MSKSDSPKPESTQEPWVVVDCDCSGTCDTCDGARWYYLNTCTKQTVSEMVRDALDRHG